VSVGDDLVQGAKLISDERNFSSLADEFDVAMATAAEADEVIVGSDADTESVDVGSSTVRRRLTANLSDNV